MMDVSKPETFLSLNKPSDSVIYTHSVARNQQSPQHAGGSVIISAYFGICITFLFLHPIYIFYSYLVLSTSNSSKCLLRWKCTLYSVVLLAPFVGFYSH